MITESSRAANALGGKTARACDSCLRRRARWFCAADDAFLCQACDTSVHSANQLASRHERVRLGTSSFKAPDSKNSQPAWHQGFARKARTPRHNKPTAAKPPENDSKTANPLLVPELGFEEEASPEENEEQLLYRVPDLDPFEAELCSVSNAMENIQTIEGGEIVIGNELDNLLKNDEVCDLGIQEFLNSEMELADFAADMETLLGKTLDDEDPYLEIEGFGSENCKESSILDDCFEGSKVKLEEDDEEFQAVIACNLDPGLDMGRETLDWDFDYASPMIGKQEEGEQMVVAPAAAAAAAARYGGEERRMLLRLDYEAVITAWDSKGCPWTSGIKPEFNPDDCWPDFLGICDGGNNYPYGGMERIRGSNEGREARVSRYREKRRTRLFSKKIRYEVRKLNAEKRPRMKGRFVKRTTSSAAGSSFPNYLIS